MSKVRPLPTGRASSASLPSLGRREQQKLDKRERIREAAWDLFTTAGYDAATTKEVAARADIASGTLFLYASDKRDLLCLVMHDRLAAVTDARFETLPKGAPLLDQLMHLFRGLFQMYGEQPGVAAAFVRHFPGADGPNGQKVNALTHAFLHRVAQLVRDKQASGEVSPAIDAFQAATNIFSLYFGALMAWLTGFVTLEAALDPGLKSSLALQIRGFHP
ncbi:MAG TPA: TetR/AcrR family transcriptional regulator [Polyangiaceae bacterium]|jgi:AcrR family transcriptional regulator|nr:TetR/AcrR family transcriptional regulator [Polyangiaceae bacterium]